MLKGFKDFLIRGNVIDLAVGIIMGTAFTAVVTALVQSVLMPAISMLVQSPNFDSFLVIGQIKIGVFLTAVVNFLLIAAAVYFAVVLPVQKLNERATATRVKKRKKKPSLPFSRKSAIPSLRSNLRITPIQTY